VPNFKGNRPPDIDLILSGLDQATGRVPKYRRERDRFKVSAETREPTVYRARVDMVRDLHKRLLWPLLDARLRGRITTTQLHDAYRDGTQALLKLMEEERHGRLQYVMREYLRERPTKTQALTQQQIERFIDWIGPNATTADLTGEKVGRFLGTLTKAGRGEGQPASNATKNRYRAALYGLCSWLVARGHLQRHPIAHGIVKRAPEGGKKRLPDLSPADQQAYLAKIEERGGRAMRLVARTAIATGADVGELIVTPDNRGEALLVRDCHLAGVKQQRIRFKRHKVAGSPERLVPITATVAAELEAHIAEHGLKPGDLVFGMVLGHQFRFAHEWAREEIGWPRLTRKDLRHVAAINWRRSGADLQQVKEWLGHTSIAQTTIYSDFGNDDEFDGRVMAALENRLLRGER
jgi:integrase